MSVDDAAAAPQAAGPLSIPPAALAAAKDQGSIRFVENVVSALPAGDYEVLVGQHVANSSGSGDNPFDELYLNRHRFRVEGPRFRLDADAVRSVFPPPDSQGEYEGVVPHVVLERMTLPWERSAGPPGSNDGAPWLALLVLEDSDPGAPAAPPSGVSPWQAQTSTVASLHAAALPQGWLSYPGFSLESWERDDEACEVLDLPVALWQAIAPAYDELRWLAHARRVSSGGCSSETVPANGDLAVITGNRLPRRNQRATAHLVSLEGMAALLPDAHGALPLAAEVTHVRLLSLRSWSYASVEPLQTFAQTLKQLSVGPLQLPWREAADLAPSALTPLVRSALAKGYTALDHRGFDGQTTLAWYRGPFLPNAGAAAKAAPVIQVGTPISRATDLLCVDADSGLVDASYAAAWQLGQLLALRDQGFATALVRWKHANTLAAAAALERAVLEQQLGVLLDLPEDALAASAVPQIDHHSAALLSRIDKTMPRVDARPQPVAAYHRPSDAVQRHERLGTDPEAWAGRRGAKAVPPAITQWLGRLRLLHGVPFNYLVPEESMLPVESLRFLALDADWVSAAVDGAFSIGRSSKAVAGHDVALHEAVHAAGVSGDSATPVTGFLLRSAVVSGWPALQVTARDVDGAELEARLMIHLTPSLLLYLAAGQLHSVEISEPPEGMHFGISIEPARVVHAADAGKDCYKLVRHIVGDDAGRVVDGTEFIVSMRPPATGRVLDILATVARMREALTPAERPASPAPLEFTSAEFALQMIEGVQSVRFTNPGVGS